MSDDVLNYITNQDFYPNVESLLNKVVSGKRNRDGSGQNELDLLFKKIKNNLLTSDLNQVYRFCQILTCLLLKYYHVESLKTHIDKHSTDLITLLLQLINNLYRNELINEYLYKLLYQFLNTVRPRNSELLTQVLNNVLKLKGESIFILKCKIVMKIYQLNQKLVNKNVIESLINSDNQNGTFNLSEFEDVEKEMYDVVYNTSLDNLVVENLNLSALNYLFQYKFEKDDFFLNTALDMNKVFKVLLNELDTFHEGKISMVLKIIHNIVDLLNEDFSLLYIDQLINILNTLLSDEHWILLGAKRMYNIIKSLNKKCHNFTTKLNLSNLKCLIERGNYGTNKEVLLLFLFMNDDHLFDYYNGEQDEEFLNLLMNKIVLMDTKNNAEKLIKLYQGIKKSQYSNLFQFILTR